MHLNFGVSLKHLELQQIAFNYSSDFKYNDYQIYNGTIFLVNDTTLLVISPRNRTNTR